MGGGGGGALHRAQQCHGGQDGRWSNRGIRESKRRCSSDSRFADKGVTQGGWLRTTVAYATSVHVGSGGGCSVRPCAIRKDGSRVDIQRSIRKSVNSTDTLHQTVPSDGCVMQIIACAQRTRELKCSKNDQASTEDWTGTIRFVAWVRPRLYCRTKGQQVSLRLRERGSIRGITMACAMSATSFRSNPSSRESVKACCQGARECKTVVQCSDISASRSRVF